MNQAEFPTWMKPVEDGRDFCPDYSSDLRTFQVDTPEWEHVASARFGEARPCILGDKVRATWTGNSFRYDIFKSTGSIRPRYALRWENGAGTGWLIADDTSRRGESNLLATIASYADETARWDACHFLWEIASKTAAAAKRTEYRRVTQAFTEGRLKKRKVRGTESYKVILE